MGNIKEKKVGVAVLYSTRYDKPKGNRIGPLAIFYIRTTEQIYKDYLLF